ncbi:MAG: glycosyltransferase family 4 protein [Thermoplasmata archaeon]
MRIAQLSGDAPSNLGGVARLVQILRDGLVSRGHEVLCLSPRAKVGDIKLSPLAFSDLSSFDIVHVHGPTPLLSDLVRLNPTVGRLVLTYHSENEWFSHTISRAYLQVHRLLYTRTRGIVLNTQSYRARYGAFRGKVSIIPPPGPGWEPEPGLLARKSDRFTVIFVGQFRPYKGLPVLLEAAAQLPTVRFVICGGGRLERATRNMSRGLTNVEFRGALSETELRSEYAKSHVVCLPSVNNSEAYGMVLSEGATVGAFPIASRLPGVSEHVELLEGETFPARDVSALVSILRSLSTDHDFWRERASRSMQRAANYNETHDAEWYCDAHEAFYRSLIDR